MVSVYVIDDDILVCWGFQNFFEAADGVVTAGFAHSCEEAVDDLKRLKVDVIILDLHIRDSRPVNNLRFLTDRFPGVPVVICSFDSATFWQRRMFEAGARGFLVKGTDRQTIRETILRVARGNMVIPHGLLIPGEGKRSPKKMVMDDNQRLILKNLAEGKTLKEIAVISQGSLSSVEKSLKKTRKLFQARTNCQLIAILRELKEI